MTLGFYAEAAVPALPAQTSSMILTIAVAAASFAVATSIARMVYAKAKAPAFLTAALAARMERVGVATMAAAGDAPARAKGSIARPIATGVQSPTQRTIDVLHRLPLHSQVGDSAQVLPKTAWK